MRNLQVKCRIQKDVISMLLSWNPDDKSTSIKEIPGFLCIPVSKCSLNLVNVFIQPNPEYYNSDEQSEVFYIIFPNTIF